ncbi:MAG: hypothetical protein KC910_17330, partial [Candidatus Eremiobacteraeota bacterium]|nr:hypothetical protein [Candidatus Eremiobacteraeota bacterium]
DPTVDELAHALPDGARVAVVGWPDRLAQAFARRGDVEVRVIDVDGDGPGFVRHLERLDVDAVDVAGSGAAAAVADGELSRVVRAATLDDPPGELTRFWAQDYPTSGAAFSTGSVSAGGTAYDFEVHTQTVLSEPDGTNRIKQVLVTVTWWGGQRQGHGRLSTQASRLVTEPE